MEEGGRAAGLLGPKTTSANAPPRICQAEGSEHGWQPKVWYWEGTGYIIQAYWPIFKFPKLTMWYSPTHIAQRHHHWRFSELFIKANVKPSRQNSDQNRLIQHLTPLHVGCLNVDAVSPALPGWQRTARSLPERREKRRFLQDLLTLACLGNTWCKEGTCSRLRTEYRVPRVGLQRQRCGLSAVYLGVTWIILQSTREK